MPLSEFYGMTRGKIESTQQRTPYSTDQFALRDNDFVELVWENGQIMMQGQSSRRIPISNNFPSQAMKLRDKDLENDTNKIEKFGTLESAFSDFATAISSREIGLSQDDDTVPWWNYPMVNSPQQDYCFELLSELSGVTVNDISAQNKFSSIDYKNSCNQTIRDTNSASMHNGLSLEQGSNVSSSEVDESSISRSGQFFPWSFQESQTSIPSFPSGISNNNNSGDTKCDNCGDSIQAQSLVNDLFGIQIQKQSSGLPNTSSGLINFSHFSRPIALVRANLQNIDAMGGENKAIAPSSSNLIEPMLVNLNGLRNEMGSHNQPNSIPPQVDLEIGVAKPLEEPHNVCPEDSAKNDKLPKQIFGVSASKGMSQGEKTIDPVVASSSVDSGNSGERASNDPTHNLKRKYRETDDSEGRSEDVEEESVSVRKVAAAKGGVGSKRSRAAEVHNLSERKRRDRINEKMRALQELIPNCNKVDKASMLDEAIEYLKTLQLQAQIMSMGTGLYVPPMMSPTGMQHMNAAYMAHFSPMVGGVGMGMVMNNGSLRWPTVHAPSMQGSHFSAPNSQTILGPTNLQGMGGSNLHVIGHPGQRLATSSLRPHLAPLSGGPPLSLAAELNPNGAFVAREVPSLAPTTHSKDLLQTIDSQMVHNTDANSSMNQESRQCSVTTDGSECATLVAPDVGLTKENENLPSSKTTCCDRNQLRNFSKEVDSFCCI